MWIPPILQGHRSVSLLLLLLYSCPLWLATTCYLRLNFFVFTSASITDLLTEREFVGLDLKDIVYMNQPVPESLPDTTQKYSLTPSAVRGWDAFLPSVLGMQLDNRALYMQPFSPPDRQIDAKASLHHIFSSDVGSVRSLPPFARTHVTCGLVYGIPDLVCSFVGDDGISRILFPLVMRTKDVLQLADGVSFHIAYREQGSGSKGPAGALNQLYGYMKLNGYRYGVLSTYTQTWFVKIEGDNDDEILVSPTMSFKGTTPTVRQCYIWLIRTALVDGRMDVEDETAQLVVNKTRINKIFKRVWRRIGILFPRR